MRKISLKSLAILIIAVTAALVLSTPATPASVQHLSPSITKVSAANLPILNSGDSLDLELAAAIFVIFLIIVAHEAVVHPQAAYANTDVPASRFVRPPPAC